MSSEPKFGKFGKILVINLELANWLKKSRLMGALIEI